jgi:tRNA-specific 2-thiouridylase
MYVVGTDRTTNTVTVGPREALARERVFLSDVMLHRPREAVTAVKLRYRSKAVPCRMEGDAVLLEHAFSAPAAGQTAVLLDGETIVGCGTIAP